MPSCVLRFCKNNIKKFNKSNGITYHQFPALGLRRRLWVEIVRRERSQLDWTPTKHTRICSAHFRDEDKYVASGDRVYIMKTALPVIGDQSFEEYMQKKIQTAEAEVELLRNNKKALAVSYQFASKIELQGRIQQLLIQKKILTEKCITWKRKCVKLQKRLASLNQDSAHGRDAKRSSLKWMDSEVFGI